MCLYFEWTSVGHEFYSDVDVVSLGSPLQKLFHASTL